jgi:predicted HAD superfamily Cof-like phosphohydrolase
VDLYALIKEFHTKFKLDYEGPPRNLDSDLATFRIDFMDEELSEYALATTTGVLHGQLDALVDLVYVALGTAYMQGFNFNEAFKRVHEANMNKVRTPSTKESLRNSEYDVVKPKGWVAPDLSDLVK